VIHMRTDDGPNATRTFLCGIGPALPPGDVYYFMGERDNKIDCPGCATCNPLFQGPIPPHEYGVPLSQVTGRMLDRMADEWRSL
jgi:hypothetical protein